jgi:hypothetical protein
MSDVPPDSGIQEEHPKSAPADRDTTGPLDEAEANHVRPYVDLGGVKVLPRPELALRLEVEEGGARVVAVALDYAGSTLQVQPFAAPRNSGLWHEIREQIVDQIARQGGSTATTAGPFGPEIRAEIPAPGGESSRIARFIGVDGLVDPEAAARVEELFRSIVVVRGSTPMPPRDLIPLQVPPSMAGGAPQSV